MGNWQIIWVVNLVVVFFNLIFNVALFILPFSWFYWVSLKNIIIMDVIIWFVAFMILKEPKTSENIGNQQQEVKDG